MASGRRVTRKSKPSFLVRATLLAEQDLDELRGEYRKAARRLHRELERSGCRAAGYRLSGKGVEHVCSVRLRDNWRMLVFFPAEDQVSILLVGPHDRENPQVDVYMRLYELLELEAPDDEHRRPSCCEDGQPPVDAELLERVIDRTKELTRSQRRVR